MKLLLVLFIFVITFSGSNAQQSACKCCTEFHDDFDFWIGNWKVTNTNGEILGYNTIEKIQDACGIKENWKSAKGSFTGMSTNFFNAQTNQWEQLWLDNQGGSLHLKGNRIDNQMILQTKEETNKNGNPFFHRITWTKNNDGTVRQYWETITNGTNISVAFDGLYTKIEK